MKKRVESANAHRSVAGAVDTPPND